jgi:hypothetical protein
LRSSIPCASGTDDVSWRKVEGRREIGRLMREKIATILAGKSDNH